MHACMHACMLVCMYVCVCLHACMHACMYVCVCVCVSVCACVVCPQPLWHNPIKGSFLHAPWRRRCPAVVCSSTFLGLEGPAFSFVRIATATTCAVWHQGGGGASCIAPTPLLHCSYIEAFAMLVAYGRMPSRSRSRSQTLFRGSWRRLSWTPGTARAQLWL